MPENLRLGGYLWSKAVLFLRQFDPIQVRYAGHEWRQLVELVVQGAEAASKARWGLHRLIFEFISQLTYKQPLVAVPLIRDAVLRLDPSSATFTSIHLIFVRLCLRARAYTHAIPIIDKHICHFPTSSEQSYHKHRQPFLCARHESSAAFITYTSGLSAKLTYRDHLQYYLYGGMIYMALKKWSKALHFLSIVISSPIINSVSMIMVEAYKKWILVSLLEQGKVGSIINGYC